MRYQKDEQIKTAAEIRAMHPTISFADSTYAELGWSEYIEVASPVDPVAHRRNAIIWELAEIDRKSIRALRENDSARIAQWEQAAQALRAELAGL